MRPSLPRYQSIIDAPEPTTVVDVYHGTNAMGWSRSFIPNFAVMERPIRTFIMKALNGGAQTMRRAKNRKLANHGWNEELKTAYKRIKLALVNAIKRAYRDQDKIPFLIWDSSKFAWSYTVGQVDPEELMKAWEDMDVDMLVTKSGIYDRTQYRWDICSKEGYPPWRAIKKESKKPAA